MRGQQYRPCFNTNFSKEFDRFLFNVLLNHNSHSILSSINDAIIIENYFFWQNATNYILYKLYKITINNQWSSPIQSYNHSSLPTPRISWRTSKDIGKNMRTTFSRHTQPTYQPYHLTIIQSIYSYTPTQGQYLSLIQLKRRWQRRLQHLIITYLRFAWGLMVQFLLLLMRQGK